MTFNDEGRESYLFLDTVDQIDYYFMGGNTMDGIIHAYRYLTGKAQMLPKWAYGYIQSKEQYYTSKELEKLYAITEKSGFRWIVWFRTGIPGIRATGGEDSGSVALWG